MPRIPVGQIILITAFLCCLLRQPLRAPIDTHLINKFSPIKHNLSPTTTQQSYESLSYIFTQISVDKKKNYKDLANLWVAMVLMLNLTTWGLPGLKFGCRSRIIESCWELVLIGCISASQLPWEKPSLYLEKVRRAAFTSKGRSSQSRKSRSYMSLKSAHHTL